PAPQHLGTARCRDPEEDKVRTMERSAHPQGRQRGQRSQRVEPRS
ncbi:hypothetical protein BN1723_020460, partial [Verticillium longisporum]